MLNVNQSLRQTIRSRPSSLPRVTHTYFLFSGTSLKRNSSKAQIQTTESPCVAVLYQAIDPPVIDGVRKLQKPGGHQDSGADIAFVLRHQCKIEVVTPSSSITSHESSGWCFPDTEEGIQNAIEKGATHIWANTILFASHPLQTSSVLKKFDNKAYVNDRLRANGSFPMPRGWTFNLETDLNVQKDLKSFLALFNLPFPIVGKPVRGRGSQGVKVCRSPKELNDHLQSLSAHSPTVMLEKFLSGEEATITVMPPTTDVPRYWAMPIVTRFNHEDDIAPYNGVVAVTSNSRVLAKEELQKDNRYSEASKQCERIAELMQATAPIRVDIRRYNRNPDTPFAIFDINMKPNMTGPGRPGREDQASLTAMSAAALGWTYPTLLQKFLVTARPLSELRRITPKL